MRAVVFTAFLALLAGCGSGEEPPPPDARTQQAPTTPVVKPEPPVTTIIIPARPWPYVNPQPVYITKP
ncbi:MAG: hypothetical protein RIS35_2473 [Pseudomonadota bacterium]|jgi:hypothetical protein